jgi:hypothetical protein
LPSGVAFLGNAVFVTDAQNHRVQKFVYLPVAAVATTLGRVKAEWR